MMNISTLSSIKATLFNHNLKWLNHAQLCTTRRHEWHLAAQILESDDRLGFRRIRMITINPKEFLSIVHQSHPIPQF